MTFRGWFLAVSAVLAASCGGSSSTAPSIERVSGAWIGHATLSAASGGECVGPTLQSAVGSGKDIFSARIQQTGSDLAASITYQGNRTSCLYQGNTQSSSVTLDVTSCPAARIDTFRCADGTFRDLQVSASHLSAQARGTTGSGSETTTYTVFAPGSTSALGTLTVTSQFVWNLLGLPHNDFHIFDGSILPGYVDGVTIIPEEPNPFCTICGWF